MTDVVDNAAKLGREFSDFLNFFPTATPELQTYLLYLYVLITYPDVDSDIELN